MTKQRRAVVATEFWHGATGRSLAQALREVGWLVAEVDWLAYTSAGRGIAARAASRLMSPVQKAEFGRAILAAAQSIDADVFLTLKGDEVSDATLAALRARGTTTVVFYPDYEFEATGMPVARLDNFDLVATTKSFHIDFLRSRLSSARVALVHHGFDPLVHRPVAAARDYARDVGYVGNASAYKLAWLAPVAAALPDVSMGVFGARWDKLAAGTPLERAVAGRQVSGDFYAREIGRSRINISLHMGPSKNYGWQDMISTRTFEIPACGGFMLHIDNPEVRTMFDVPREMDVFGSTDELVAKVRYYLDHAGEREATAARGHARAMRDHRLAVRAGEIDALVTAIRAD